MYRFQSGFLGANLVEITCNVEDGVQLVTLPLHDLGQGLRGCCFLRDPIAFGRQREVGAGLPVLLVADAANPPSLRSEVVHQGRAQRPIASKDEDAAGHDLPAPPQLLPEIQAHRFEDGCPIL